jgi:predicted GNAT family N-acyltransferase
MDGASQLRWVSDARDVAHAVAIRERVFCEEQGVPHEEERDGLDDSSLHLLAFAPDASKPVATLRLQVNGAVARIGRLAVERDWRRRGIATRMLALALERARQAGCQQALLAAQLGARRLYEQAGFAVDSEPFQEAGITHVWMSRPL